MLQKGCGLLSAFYQEDTSVCLLIDDVNLDHLIKVVSAKFFHHKVTVCPFVTNKHIVRR